MSDKSEDSILGDVRVCLHCCDPPVRDEGGATLALSWSLCNALKNTKAFILTRRFDRKFQESDIAGGLEMRSYFYKDASVLGLRRFSQDLRNIVDCILWVFQLPRIIGLLKEKQCQLIITTVGNHWCPVAKAYLLKLASGIRSDIYMMDDLEESAKIQGSRVGAWFARTCERLLLGKFDTVWTISKGYGEHLSGKYGIANTRLLPVPIRGSSVKHTILVEEDPKVTYIGYLGSIHGFYEESIQILLDELYLRNKEGNGKSYKIKLFKLAIPPDLDKRFRHSELFDLRTGLSNKELLLQLGTCWFNFLPYTFLEEYRISVSTSFSCKIAEYILSGRPIGVFGPAYSSVSRHFNEMGIPLVVNDQGKISDLFDELLAINEEKLAMDYDKLIADHHSPHAIQKYINQSLQHN